MKLRKILCVLLIGAMTFGTATGCITDDDTTSTTGVVTPPGDNDIDLSAAPEMDVDHDVLEELGLQYVDGFYRFDETKHIRVMVWDRGREDGRTDPADCYWSKWLQHQVLRDLNIEVEFVKFWRDTEQQELSNLFASGEAPDIVLTYENPAIQAYADMDGILNMDPYVTGLAFLAPNLWDLLGPDFIYFNRDPQNGYIWSISGVRHDKMRINTFVREDWLKKLSLPEPKTIDEFEGMLYEFKGNAQTLLGSDADKMIPLTLDTDVGWRGDHLIASFIPDDISDKDIYVYGFDDRMFTFPGVKEGVRKLNSWYNAGLIWQDFHLHGGRGDQTEDNNMKAGYVGAMIHNWSWPYMNNENGVQGMMRRTLNDESAGFIPVTAFQNDAGHYRKFLPAASDRFICFPRTNPEPEASLLYLDYVSRLDVRSYLGSGEEGINFERVLNNDGELLAVRNLTPTSEAVRNNIFTSDPAIINPRTGDNTWLYSELIMNREGNFDYLMTFNTDGNIYFESDEIAAASQGFGFPEAEPEVIGRAIRYSSLDGRIRQNVQVGTIEAETGRGRALGDKREAVLVNAVIASPEQFDSVFDSGMTDYLASGGQAIIDERKAKWEANFGDITSLTDVD
ncbi:MAG: extracellular solute-binding protein [Oscillospiraceae bacterium]|nr:extracellular solute-binding protein [Oscillospiraceae bacterium]